MKRNEEGLEQVDRIACFQAFFFGKVTEQFV